MKDQRIRSIFITGLLVLLTMGAFAQEGNQPGAHDMQMPMMAMGQDSVLAGLQGEAFDVAFMSMMIPHHEGAIEMAKWIMERTEDQELLEAAEAIIAEQEQEIMQMAAWLEDWYGQEPDEAMGAMMRSENETMQGQMEAASNPEQAFLEMMTEHHMSAIDMAQLALTHTEQPELRALARDIILAQAEEIYQYQEWLAAGKFQ